MATTTTLQGTQAIKADLQAGDAETAVRATTEREPVALIRLLYRQVPAWVLLHTLAAVAVSYLLGAVVPAHLVVPWLVFLVLTGGLYLLLAGRFHQQRGDDGHWGSTVVFMATLYGLAWSTGAALFAPYLDAQRQVSLLLAVPLVVATTAPMLAGAQRALAGYLLAAGVPLVLGTLSLGAGRFMTAAGIAIPLGAGVLVILRTIQRSLAESHAMVAEYVQLGRALSAENSDNLERIEKLRHEVVSSTHALVKIQRDRERATSTLQALGEGVITTDINGLIDYMNPVAEVLTGWNFREVRGKPLMSIFNIVNRITGEHPLNPVEQCLITERAVIGDDNTVLMRRDGIEYGIEHVGSPIRDRTGRFTGAALIFRDVTEKRELQTRLNWAASHDALTGLINRNEFDLRLRRVLDNTPLTGKGHALCYIDLDHFKTINDSCGHVAGDEFLVRLAECLRTRLRGADTLARLGGDEFAALLYSCPIDKAKLIAEGIRQLISDFCVDWRGRSLRVGASIGVVEMDGHTTDLTELLAAADIACYTAKNEGRNRVHVFHDDDDMIARRHGEIRWLRSIQKALVADDFVLYYQPIVPLDSTDQGRRCELLLRLRDEDGSITGPRDFLPAARRYHLMPEIDRWVVKAALDALRFGHPLLAGMESIGINLSGQSICDERFLGFVLSQIDDDDVPAAKLCFEITEIELISNVARARYFVAALRNKGCRFALDDFGAGMSSFSYLKKLEIDYLKINEEFIRNLDFSSVDYEIVLSLNRVARSIGVKTVVECDADESARARLQRLGIDYVQGRSVGHPQPIDLRHPVH